MDAVLSQLLAGLAYAATLFLVAAGLTLVFGVTRVVNFAHGSFYMLGAYLALTIVEALPRTPLAFFGGLIAAGLVVAAFAVVVEVLILRRIYAAPEIFQLLATFGVVLIVQDATLWLWGPEEKLGPRAPGFTGAVEIFGAFVPTYSLLLLLLGPAVYAALWWVFRRTRWGLDVRAAATDGEMATALGVNRKLVFTTVVALGGFLAGLAGALQIPRESVNLQMDLTIVVEAFVVVVVGGLGSITGAFLAAALIGLLHAFGIWWLPQSSLVLAFAAMALVLVLRPQGLLGRAAPPPAASVAAHPPYRPADLRLKLAAALGLLFAATLPLWGNDYALAIATEMAVAALFAASLHFFMSHGGVVSFGHAAFFGLGAYGAALLAKYLGTSLGVGLLAGPLLAAGVAAAAGLLVLRSHGVYAAMLTLALAQILWSGATQWVAFTGGDNGILGLWPPAVLASKWAYYLLTLALVVAVLWALRRAALAPYGYALRAVRDARPRAEASAVDAPRLLLAGFVVGGLLAGLAGVLNAWQKGSVFPAALSVGKSLDALVMVLAGGVQTLSGPLVGALAYHGLAVELTRVTDHWRLLLGTAIVLLVVAFPQGLAGFARARLERGAR
ncbi:MAG: ABC transporter permease [Betaproteobacteria bacterium]